jgi:hypothetical protein
MTIHIVDESQLRNFSHDMLEMLKYFAETAADLGWVKEEIEARYLMLQLEYRTQKIGAQAKKRKPDAPQAVRRKSILGMNSNNAA